jgi:transcriptional regulator GlxA family with amidase domain
MKVTPAHTFADCPPADIVIIPGGSVDRVEGDAASIAWLRERVARAQFVLSVCNGAFILAATGALDRLSATTFYDLIDAFEGKYGKNVKAVRDRRYVDNGKFVTTAGISSGIDGSLHVISKLRGRAAAQKVALNMEYDWKPEATYARASFADRHLRRVFQRNLRLEILEGVAPLLAHTQGDRDRWEVEWRVVTPLAASELLARLDRTVGEKGGWKRAEPVGAGTATRWTLAEDGAAWNAVTEVASDGKPNRYRVRVRVERA